MGRVGEQRVRRPPRTPPREVRPQQASPGSLLSMFSSTSHQEKTKKRGKAVAREPRRLEFPPRSSGRKQETMPSSPSEGSVSIASSDSSVDEDDPWLAAPASRRETTSSKFLQTSSSSSSRDDQEEKASFSDSSDDAKPQHQQEARELPTSNIRKRKLPPPVKESKKRKHMPLKRKDPTRKSHAGSRQVAPTARREDADGEDSEDSSISDLQEHAARNQQDEPSDTRRQLASVNKSRPRRTSSQSQSETDEQKYDKEDNNSDSSSALAEETDDGDVFTAENLFHDDGSGKKQIDSYALKYSITVMKQEATRVAREHARRLKEQGRRDESRRLLVAADRQAQKIIEQVRKTLRSTKLPLAYAPTEDSCKKGMEAVNQQRREDIQKTQRLSEKLKQQHERLEKQLATEEAKREKLLLDKEAADKSSQQGIHPALAQYLSNRNNLNAEESQAPVTSYRPAPKGTMTLLLQKMAGHH